MKVFTALLIWSLGTGKKLWSWGIGIFIDDSASNTLRLLVVGPNLNVPTWKGYDINHYSFYTKSQDDKSSVQNSWVSVDGHSDHFCSASDNNLIHMSMHCDGDIAGICSFGKVAWDVSNKGIL